MAGPDFSDERAEAISFSLLAARVASIAEAVLDDRPLTDLHTKTLSKLSKRLEVEASLLRGEQADGGIPFDLSYAFVRPAFEALHTLSEAVGHTADEEQANPTDLPTRLDMLAARLRGLMTGNSDHAAFLRDLFDSMSSQIRLNTARTGEAVESTWAIAL